ncbi:PEP/pyruvate-binding domain-containing protein [Deinococcus maricopensis]|uniref:Pyruvate phosphate dikinase PEP/pyruvate-binding protein n=1 Tax=Deinococcus maricopensis (strain DSM 21211 / LMG 22137 / NRRL B-23946 / LB-34) TaxID=709986 RepID=E8U6X9_DEIML|nr:PEP/pyruvate-binding domain-containing protein [Deinococcus maricopensis]ADV66818.1 pyruvate phosphate dikinase PEP/pyruvate-binding protein [Deinococcus maricopensis DSM 21211]
MSVLATPHEAQAGAAGGKARALAQLQSVHRIPAWIALKPGACPPTADPDDLYVPEAVWAEVAAALPTLGTPLYAVRSSALDEDGAEHSFAGQLASYLNVPPTEVRARIADVWRSGLSGHSLAYRRERGLAPATPPGVIVQAMVPADQAGVAFSADPVTGERDVTVISAVPGLGEALVSGELTGATYHVQGERVTGTDALLRREDVMAVARLARTCEAHFGAPQDIEWALHAGELYLLQSRPITTLRAFEPRTWWDNSNIVESYSGVTTPLTFSFARRAYANVYRRFVRLLGVPDADIRAHARVFDGMIGLVGGRVYYNLTHWYVALALLPGFRVNRRFMETMMGVAEGMPADLHVQSTRGRAQDALYLARTVGGLLGAYRRLPRMREEFLARLNRVLAPADPPLHQRTLGGLAAHYRELESELLDRWDAPLVNDFFAMIFYGVLKTLCVKWLDDPHGTRQNDLITATGQMVSAEPARLIADLARLTPPELRPTLEVGTPEQIQVAVRTVPALRAAADAYLARFGDRTLDELKLESTTLTDDETPLWRSVASLARHGEPAHGAETKRDHAEADALARLSPLRRAVFRWVLREARARVRDRENLRLERTRAFGRARTLLRAAGQHLADAGVLDRADDVFYLDVEDVLGFAEGTGSTRDLGGLARVRRAEFERHALAPAPPRRFATRGAVGLSPTEVAASARPPAEGPVRAGLGCSPGVLRGPVRVVRDPRTANIHEPTILVAERTDPGWILILPMARALIVERGSLLSHSAIVARELGIPAVVAVDDLMDWLQDGDEVELDGASGTVRLLRRANEEG